MRSPASPTSRQPRPPRRLDPWHRAIEALHHLRDVTFAEDGSQVRTVPARMRCLPAHLAIRLLRRAGPVNLRGTSAFFPTGFAVCFQPPKRPQPGRLVADGPHPGRRTDDASCRARGWPQATAAPGAPMPPLSADARDLNWLIGN